MNVELDPSHQVLENRATTTIILLQIVTHTNQGIQPLISTAVIPAPHHSTKNGPLMPTNLDPVPMIGDLRKEVNTMKMIEDIADSLPGMKIIPTMNEECDQAQQDLDETFT